MSSADRVRLAIFASGAGSNALKILGHFATHRRIEVSVIVSNNPHAGVLDHAHKYDVQSLVITRKQLHDHDWLLSQLEQYDVDFIILAGFLLLIPEYLVDAFPNRIINIHPALLPKYGGKGMYGMHVHEAVKNAGETETGITIHVVNTQYDEGEIIFQKAVALEPTDTPDSIAQKVHVLEHAWYPGVIEDFVMRSTRRESK